MRKQSKTGQPTQVQAGFKIAQPGLIQFRRTQATNALSTKSKTAIGTAGSCKRSTEGVLKTSPIKDNIKVEEEAVLLNNEPTQWLKKLDWS